MAEQLSLSDSSIYRSIVGCINWIVSIRFDCKFASHVVAGRTSSARKWDMYCAVWLLNFLDYSKDWPLVLGGPIIDFCAMSDGSLAIMDERRSVKSNLLRTGPMSGAIAAEVRTIKCAVASIFDVEVMASSDGIDNLMYGKNLCAELVYENQGDYVLSMDSESAIEWFGSRKVGERSKHLELKCFKCRHMVQEGIVKQVFVDGELNTSDIITKVVGAKLHHFHARDMLGHKLVGDLQIIGVIKEASDSESI
jgi:hypothetical protein